MNLLISLPLGSIYGHPIIGWGIYVIWAICAISMILWLRMITAEYKIEGQSDDVFDFFAGRKKFDHPFTAPLLRGIHEVVYLIPDLIDSIWICIVAMVAHLIILLALSPAVLITLIVDAIPWWRHVLCYADGNKGAEHQTWSRLFARTLDSFLYTYN